MTAFEKQGGTISEKGNKIEVKTAREIQAEADKKTRRNELLTVTAISIVVGTAVFGILRAVNLC